MSNYSEDSYDRILLELSRDNSCLANEASCILQSQHNVIADLKAKISEETRFTKAVIDTKNRWKQRAKEAQRKNELLRARLEQLTDKLEAYKLSGYSKMGGR